MDHFQSVTCIRETGLLITLDSLISTITRIVIDTRYKDFIGTWKPWEHTLQDFHIFQQRTWENKQKQDQAISSITVQEWWSLMQGLELFEVLGPKHNQFHPKERIMNYINWVVSEKHQVLCTRKWKWLDWIGWLSYDCYFNIHFSWHLFKIFFFFPLTKIRKLFGCHFQIKKLTLKTSVSPKDILSSTYWESHDFWKLYFPNYK